jgi:hypothetical protein
MKLKFKKIDLTKIHEESVAVREAIAFYVAFAVAPFVCTIEQREGHYATLEQAGYLKRLV